MDAEEIFLYSRLKSARRKKRWQKKQLEKKLIALDKERHKISLQIRKLGYAPLIPPVQKGWKRVFVLRDDVRRSPRAEFFETLLKKINTVEFSDSKKFLRKRRKRGKKIYVNREQKLREFYGYEWQWMRLSDAEKFYFTETVLMNHRGELYKLYVFNEPWRYVLKILPNMIMWLQIKDAVLEQRIDEINNYLVKNNLEGKLHRLKGDRRFYWPWLQVLKYENPLENKPLHKIMEEYHCGNY